MCVKMANIGTGNRLSRSSGSSFVLVFSLKVLFAHYIQHNRTLEAVCPIGSMEELENVFTGRRRNRGMAKK